MATNQGNEPTTSDLGETAEPAGDALAQEGAEPPPPTSRTCRPRARPSALASPPPPAT